MRYLLILVAIQAWGLDQLIENPSEIVHYELVDSQYIADDFYSSNGFITNVTIQVIYSYWFGWDVEIETVYILIYDDELGDNPIYVNEYTNFTSTDMGMGWYDYCFHAPYRIDIPTIIHIDTGYHYIAIKTNNCADGYISIINVEHENYEQCYRGSPWGGWENYGDYDMAIKLDINSIGSFGDNPTVIKTISLGELKAVYK